MSRGKSNLREREIRKARHLLSDEQLLSTLRAMRRPGQSSFAVQQINDDLDQGQTLDQIFYTGETDGFHLKITREGTSRLRIEFSWTSRQTLGDGMPFSEGAGETWFVELDAAGAVPLPRRGNVWMS